MKQGLWLWPSEPKAQGRVLRSVSGAPRLVPALAAMSKSREGLSNSELDEVMVDNSEWMTLWVIRQLTSLGFVEYKVDLFGGPARYQATELGRNALQAITGKPAPRPPAPVKPAPAALVQVPAPKT